MSTNTKRVFPRSIPPVALRDKPHEQASPPDNEWPLNPDDFAAYYRFAPAALTLRECLRLRAVRKHDLEEPILDIGCGDGLFARLAYPSKQIWGIDINPLEIRRAQATASYSTLVCGSITDVSLPPGFFKSAVANCSLEHVPALDDALRNIRTSLAVGGQFIAIVPTPTWTRLLAVPSMLRAVGLPTLAQAYGEGLDRVFRHIHLYNEAEWSRRLVQAGFEVKSIETLTSRRSSWMFDVLLYPSLVGWVVKKMTGRWVVSPALRNLTTDITRLMLNALASQVDDRDEGSEFLIRAEARPDALSK
ncbi:MAG: methyltransferase domain-containing protein [Deltaproteobacteria bacterium]|nr:methyltransferase domain-containing protein [Deltaproteobacteria bacterium]